MEQTGVGGRPPSIGSTREGRPAMGRLPGRSRAAWQVRTRAELPLTQPAQDRATTFWLFGKVAGLGHHPAGVSDPSPLAAVRRLQRLERERIARTSANPLPPACAGSARRWCAHGNQPRAVAMTRSALGLGLAARAGKGSVLGTTHRNQRSRLALLLRSIRPKARKVESDPCSIQKGSVLRSSAHRVGDHFDCPFPPPVLGSVPDPFPPSRSLVSFVKTAYGEIAAVSG